MDGFKLPGSIPQDLLLIHDLVAESLPPPPTAPTKLQEEDCIDSSGDETDIASEDEIEAELLVKTEETDMANEKPIVPSDSNSDSSQSDSDESDVDDGADDSKADHDQDADDEDPVPAAATGTYFQTKHEVVETDVIIPNIEEVGPDEELEKVGEVINIIDKAVIIRGIASGISGRGAERALDSDTLLVFEDRKVMGYIYETFGPTSQPLYQVKFNQAFPLDLEKVRVSRQVFHVPRRSRFVFVNQINRYKGSDASNVHDEEPAEDEIEFSDDEAEAAHKNRKRKRGGESRAGSMTPSRFSTPTPSQMRDQDMVDDGYLTANAYAEHGPYDIDFAAGPSRPPPIPYDDPYADEYTAGPPDSETKLLVAPPEVISPVDRPTYPVHRDGEQGSGRGRGRGRGRAHERGHDRGRGRGRGRGDNRSSDRGRGPRRSSDAGEYRRSGQPPSGSPPHDVQSHRPLSPTSLAIARATGQYAQDLGHQLAQPNVHSPSTPGWGGQQPFQQPHNFGAQGYPQNYVQPHINPRFASAFGMNVGFVPPQHYPQYGQYGAGAGAVNSHPHWADEWTVHGTAQPDKSPDTEWSSST